MQFNLIQLTNHCPVINCLITSCRKSNKFINKIEFLIDKGTSIYKLLGINFSKVFLCDKVR